MNKITINAGTTKTDDGSLYWFPWPNGLTFAEAFRAAVIAKNLHGPFKSEREQKEHFTQSCPKLAGGDSNIARERTTFAKFKSGGANIVRIPDDMLDKVEEWAKSVVRHYSSGEHPGTMPWSLNLMTLDEMRQWRASRKEAADKIDIETCEIGCWYANANGCPYGIGALLGEEDHLDKGYTDKFNFVRSPDSSGWICEGDLSHDKAIALCDRINRERDARQRQAENLKAAS